VSAVAAEPGTLFSFGKGGDGRLGQGGAQDVSLPKPIIGFNGQNIVQVL